MSTFINNNFRNVNIFAATNKVDNWDFKRKILTGMTSNFIWWRHNFEKGFIKIFGIISIERSLYKPLNESIAKALWRNVMPSVKHIGLQHLFNGLHKFYCKVENSKSFNFLPVISFKPINQTVQSKNEYISI